MELFDLAMLLTTLIAAVAFCMRESPVSARWLLAVLVASAIAHLLIEGARWQMVPGYVAMALLAAAFWLERRWIRLSLASATFLLVAFAGLASWAFPVFEIPRPDGQYAVGTTSVMFVDDVRGEAYTEDPADLRRLMLRIWYPATPESGTRVAHYWEHAVTRSRAVTNGTPLPWFTFSHLGRVDTFSQWDSDVAEGVFPIVLYSHGLGVGWSSANTPVVERLASHGYIVVGIDHAFLGSAAIFPDQVITFDGATRTALNTEPPSEVREAYEQGSATTDPEEQLRLYMRAMSLMPDAIKGKVDIALRTQVEDQKAVLQNPQVFEAAKVDLASHMDPSRIGLLGMSLGGSAAVITCASEPLCKAVINLDGFHPDQAAVKLPVPSMSMHRPDNLLVLANFSNGLAESYALQIDDATHFNFFDFSIMSPLYKRLGVLGAIDGYRMVKIVAGYSLAFFNATLKGEAPELLNSDQQTNFPEAFLQKREAQAISDSPDERAE